VIVRPSEQEEILHLLPQLVVDILSIIEVFEKAKKLRELVSFVQLCVKVLVLA